MATVAEVIQVPRNVCVAALSLLQHLADDLRPSPLPTGRKVPYQCIGQRPRQVGWGERRSAIAAGICLPTVASLGSAIW